MIEDIKEILDFWTDKDGEITIIYIDKNGVKKDYEYCKDADILNHIIKLQEENKRLNKEIKEYQEELDKADSITLSCIFEGTEEATISYRECLNYLERLHSIIKEVREYNEEILKENWYGGNEKKYAKHNLEILDKENKE